VKEDSSRHPSGFVQQCSTSADAAALQGLAMPYTISSTSRLIGAILLIAGCCVGAGMLGLPVLTAAGGWTPSVWSLLSGWLFMTATGWILLEVALWFPTDTSVIQMAHRQLGQAGRWVSWGCWVFLLYALMIAYVLGTGAIVSEFASPWIDIPTTVGSLIFCGGLSLALVHGARACDLLNRLLMLGLFIGYLILVVLGWQQVEPRYLAHQNWPLALRALPILVISFGFHNLMPTLVYYLQRHRTLLRVAILAGTSIPLMAYLAWEYVALGLVPSAAYAEGVKEGLTVTQVMDRMLGRPELLFGANLFALSAVTTSFIGTSLSMMDFVKESLRMRSTLTHRWMICGIVLVPSCLIAWSYPDIFLRALTYAGAYGAIVLFGLIPALMYLKGHPNHQRAFNERLLSLVVIAGSLAIISVQAWFDLGLGQ
jgi:tyrosine-specific transport protein